MNTRFALIRKEADELRAKGLHSEAWDLYGRFVASSAEISPAIRSAIEEELKDIASMIRSRHVDEIPGRSAGRVGEAGRESVSKAPEIDADFRPPSEKQSGTDARSQDKVGVESPDWLDGMAEIYSLIASEPGPGSIPDEEPEEWEAVKKPRRLPERQPSRRGDFQQGSSFKPYFIGIAVIAVLAAYSINAFHGSNSDHRRGGPVQPPPIVYGKLPPPPGYAASLAALDIGSIEPAVARFEPHSPMGDSPKPGDAEDGRQAAPGRLLTRESSTTSESSHPGIPDAAIAEMPASEEPDPGAAIDFVLRRRDLR